MNIFKINIILFFLILVFSIINIPDAFSKMQFEDTSEYAGINYYGFSYGSSWGDFNGDGFPDLWTGNHGGHGNGSQLFINNADGTFNIHQNLGFNDFSNYDIHTATWVDFDNDGDDDLMIMSGAAEGQGQAQNLFLINNNNLFEESAIPFGLDYSLGRGRNALWFDWNNDGLLDVVLNNFPRPDRQAPTALFIQNMSTFSKIFTFDKIERTQSAQISKLFPDDSTHLIFLNPTPEGIYNLKKIPFENILNKINLKKHTSLDLIISDFNGDLSQDIFRSTGGWDNKPFQNDLLEFNAQNDELTFMTKSEFSEPTSCIGTAGGDFDNDMDVDIYMVCSIWGKLISGTSEKRSDKNISNFFLENLGDGNFVKIVGGTGAEGTELGAGETVSVADYDNDGFLDLFVTNGGGWTNFKMGGPHQLFKNLGNENNWIELDLEGTISNRDGVGTEIYVTTDKKTQFREQMGGVHFRAQNFQRIHFGLGNNTDIDQILIKWPSGIVHAIKNISSNQILTIKELPEPIPPKHQIDLGVDKSKILCKDGFNLLINSKMTKAACVKISSWDKLKNRGW